MATNSDYKEVGEKSEDDNDGSLGSTVASHYNQLENTGIEARKESRIFHMRGFNNWLKSMLLNEFISKVRHGHNRGPLTVLDLGAGKGGDLKKWKIANSTKVILADIATTSVEQSKERYEQMKKQQNPRYPLFDAEFIAADCSKERLRTLYKDPDTKLDVTSCQFVYHYSFETIAQADMMLRNACENLRPGGYFLGTTTDAREIMRRLKESDETNTFGNSVYRVTFPESPIKEDGDESEGPALFGCKYDFHLEGVVDCPEFLVNFKCLEKLLLSDRYYTISVNRLAEKYDMRLVYKKNFSKLYTEKIKHIENLKLLQRMSAFEEYPAAEGKTLAGGDKSSYKSAELKLEELKKNGSHINKVLTISQEEWEAITLYLAFAFQKVTASSLESRTLKRSTENDHLDAPDRKAPTLVHQT